MKSTRMASIGKGNKYDFTKEHKGKNCQFYELGSDFSPKNPFAPSHTFGISRSYYDKVYYETNKTIDKNVPGPGKYSTLKPFGIDAPKFSIKGKNEEKLVTNSNKVPGPGEYQVAALNPTGKHFSSKFQSATNIMFGASKSNRFNYLGK
jgi:hypothetical protein